MRPKNNGSHQAQTEHWTSKLHHTSRESPPAYHQVNEKPRGSDGSPALRIKGHKPSDMATRDLTRAQRTSSQLKADVIHQGVKEEEPGRRIRSKEGFLIDPVPCLAAVKCKPARSA